MTQTISNDAPVTRMYKGIEIEFDTKAFRFVIRANPGADSDGWPRETRYGAYDQATSAIDAFFTTKAAAEKKALSVSFNVITDDGQSVTITGINRRDGNVSVTGYRSRSTGKSLTYDRAVYLARGWVGPLIAERNRLREELSKVESVLDKVKVAGNRAYRGGIDPEQYSYVIDRLNGDFAAANQRADEYEAKLAKEANSGSISASA